MLIDNIILYTYKLIKIETLGSDMVSKILMT